MGGDQIKGQILKILDLSEFAVNYSLAEEKAEGLKAFLSLSFPRVILGNFGKKPFPEFLKAFPDLERD